MDLEKALKHLITKHEDAIRFLQELLASDNEPATIKSAAVTLIDRHTKSIEILKQQLPGINDLQQHL